MIKIIVENKYSYIRGATPNTIKQLDSITSYLVAGFMYSNSFKQRIWDGREHLIDFVPKKGYRVPTGIIQDVQQYLEKKSFKYKIINNKKIKWPKINLNWNSKIILRDYQKEAVEKVCSGKKWLVGNCLLKMPIRSGKTKTAAGIIYKLKRRSLFVVPSQLLLHQTVKSFQEVFGPIVGTIGDGIFDMREITVATIQTLSKYSGYKKKIGNRWVKKPPSEKFLEISNYFDVVFFDEAHHLSGEHWRSIILDMDCCFKIGLSASIHLENKRENERGVIWLKACCGNIRYEIDTSFLVKRGYLMKQNIELVVIDKPTGYEECSWSSKLSYELIYENTYRNNKIVEKIIEKKNLGLKILVISNNHRQLIALNKILIDNNIGHAIIIGKDKAKNREIKIQAFLNNEIDVLLGTVFGEGVDIPEIECVINAEGGKDIKKAIQRMRNMTPAKGKKQAVFVDFADMTSKYFSEHSVKRLRIYRDEPSFQIKILKN